MSSKSMLAVCAVCGWGLGACADAAGAPTWVPAAKGACHYQFESSAARMGASGQALLLYACEGDACTGEERFTLGTQHAISVEVEAAPEVMLSASSSNPEIVSIADVASAYDPCAERVKLWATLEAHGAGDAAIEITDANGALDTIAVTVAEPASIRLRATRIADFSFAAPYPMLLATAGESLLVLPELYDASGALLVGLPELAWLVDDPSVAAVRTAPKGDAEARVREQAASGTAFVDAKRAGDTSVRVHTHSGAHGSLVLRVASP